MSTTTRLACPRWCRNCLYSGNDHTTACHASRTILITDPDPDPETPDVFATVSVERLDRNGEAGVPRVRIETGDQVLSYEAWRMVNRAVEQLYTEVTP